MSGVFTKRLGPNMHKCTGKRYTAQDFGYALLVLSDGVTKANSYPPNVHSAFGKLTFSILDTIIDGDYDSEDALNAWIDQMQDLGEAIVDDLKQIDDDVEGP